VAQVERRAHAAIALVGGDHRRLVHARALDRVRQRLARRARAFSNGLGVG